MKGQLGWDASFYLPFGDYIVIFLNDLESLKSMPVFLTCSGFKHK